MKIFTRLFLTSAILISSSAFAEKAELTAEQTTTDLVNVSTELAYPMILRSTDENYLKVSLKGGDIFTKAERSPINVSLVIDRSGSMSGPKIQQAREAALLAVDMLSGNDMISIIGYDNTAEVIVPATKLTDKKDVKAKIRRSIQSRGNTALFAGVSKGMKETEKFFDENNVNRIILLSDGQANVGPSSTSELGEFGKSIAKKGITLSTIGLGLGYNEDLMTALANYSDGNHVFVESESMLSSVFQSEFNDVMNVVAQNITINIDIKNAKPVKLLGREGEIRGNNVKVNLSQIYAQQEKYVLLSVAPDSENRKGEKVIADVSVSYNQKDSKTPHTVNKTIKMVYTDSQTLVDKTVNESVLADYYIQKSNLANEMAIEALDKGDNSLANSILLDVSKEVNKIGSSFRDSKARSKMQVQSSNLGSSADEALKEAPSKARKSLKEQSYQTKKQQN